MFVVNHSDDDHRDPFDDDCGHECDSRREEQIRKQVLMAGARHPAARVGHNPKERSAQENCGQQRWPDPHLSRQESLAARPLVDVPPSLFAGIEIARAQDCAVVVAGLASPDQGQSAAGTNRKIPVLQVERLLDSVVAANKYGLVICRVGRYLWGGDEAAMWTDRSAPARTAHVRLELAIGVENLPLEAADPRGAAARV